MTKQTLARGWFGLTALVALIGLVTQVVVTGQLTSGHFDTVAGRVANLFCFFTIQSNIIVMVTCALLAADLERRSTVFKVFRLAGVLGIAVTGVVFHTVLSGLNELEGAAAFADLMLHSLSPLLCVSGWLAFGPRGWIDTRVIGLAALFPVLWLVFTLVRGPIVDFYPYPFLDVRLHGYGMVLVNSLVVAALFLAMAFGARAVDRAMLTRTTA